VAMELAPGQSIADGTGNLAVLARGRARVLTPAMAGGVVATATLQAGDTFGLSALLSGSGGSRLEAIEATSLLVLTDDHLLGIVATIPSVAEAMMGREGPVVPQGGQKLSRMTIGMKSDQLASLMQAAMAPAPGIPAGASQLGEDGRRMTGMYPSVRQ
jgi:CRP-like cAMP-binding protein